MSVRQRLPLRSLYRAHETHQLGLLRHIRERMQNERLPQLLVRLSLQLVYSFLVLVFFFV